MRTLATQRLHVAGPAGRSVVWPRRIQRGGMARALTDGRQANQVTASRRIRVRGRADREAGRRIRPGRPPGRGYPNGYPRDRGERALRAAHRAKLLELAG